MKTMLQTIDGAASQEYWRGNISGYNVLTAEMDELKLSLDAKSQELDSKVHTAGSCNLRTWALHLGSLVRAGTEVLFCCWSFEAATGGACSPAIEDALSL